MEADARKKQKETVASKSSTSKGGSSKQGSTRSNIQVRTKDKLHSKNLGKKRIREPDSDEERYVARSHQNRPRIKKNRRTELHSSDLDNDEEDDDDD